MVPNKRDFVTLNKSVINYLTRCSYCLLYLYALSVHCSILGRSSAFYLGCQSKSKTILSYGKSVTYIDGCQGVSS